MQRFLSLALALCLGLTLSLDVHAKRFGGGKSMGAAPSHQSRQAAPPANAATPGKAAPAAAASGASRWLGPLAGLAAGGLLAAMFMGGAFDGLQIFDLLIIALIAFLAFRFIASRRRQAQPSLAGHAPLKRDLATPSGSLFGKGASAAPRVQAPAWFDEQRFLAAAREHFMALQQHWDANEMPKIAEFVTPQLLTFLSKERAELGDAFQSTYIDDLQVRLEGLDDRPEQTIATVTFSGIEKSSRFDQGEAFSESWRLERLQGEHQPWRVAGIRQN